MPTATDARRQRAASLRARANCHASSEGEKETARKLLGGKRGEKNSKKEGLTSTGLPDKIRVWTTEASLRQPDGNRLVHRKGLAWFVDHVRDGQWIDSRTIPLSKTFGSGDFYNILYWLAELGLVEKSGSRYRIVSTRDIVSAWNSKVESLKIEVNR